MNFDLNRSYTKLGINLKDYYKCILAEMKNTCLMLSILAANMEDQRNFGNTQILEWILTSVICKHSNLRLWPYQIV